jgi:hypothetical protein
MSVFDRGLFFAAFYSSLGASRSIGDYLAQVQVRSKLRLFQDALLQLLHRDPEKRPSMKQFCHTCALVLGEQTEPTLTEDVATQPAPQEASEEDFDDLANVHGLEAIGQMEDGNMVRNFGPSRAI